jgi:hypothetical protein
MPRINVAEAEMKGPKGEKVPVKVLEVESIDGLTAQIVIPAEMAPELAAALEGRKVVTAKEVPDGS